MISIEALVVAVIVLWLIFGGVWLNNRKPPD